MRIKRPFGERLEPSNAKESKIKYIFVYEGYKTERQYFEGVAKNRSKLNINHLFEFIPLLKDFKEAGFSNPKKLFNYLDDYLTRENGNNFSIPEIARLLIEGIEDFDKNNLSDSDKSNYYLWIRFRLRNEFKIMDDFTNIEIVPSVVEKIKGCLQDEIQADEFFDNLEEYLNFQCFVFDNQSDKVCIIVDRDSKSFVSKQYDELLQKSKDKRYKLYITNPCFEFWLLLHFDKVFQLNLDKIKTNESVKPKLKYTEYELKKIIPNFDKNNVPFEAFIDQIDNAINNEKKFTEDLNELKNELGSNVGLLISELKQK